MTRSKLRSQSAEPRPSGSASCSDCDGYSPLVSPLRHPSLGSFASNFYLATAVRGGCCACLLKLLGRATGEESSRPWAAKLLLRSQCFQSYSVAYHQRRTFQTNQLLLFEFAQQPGDGFAR